MAHETHEGIKRRKVVMFYDETDEMLDKLSEEMGISRSEVLRELITERYEERYRKGQEKVVDEDIEKVWEKIEL